MVTYPEDWDVLKLNDIGCIQMCRRIFQVQTKKAGQIPFYKIGTFGNEADAYISRELFEMFKNMYPYPEKGDILLSAAGTVGKTVVFDGRDSYYQDSNIVWLKLKRSDVDKSFLYYFYKSFPWRALEGTTIGRLYNNIILDTDIYLPSLPEQQAIASVLSDFDEYIDNLTELIEKKKAIRDGALEDLISGRTRLDGFGGEWEEKTLKDLGDILTGLTYSPDNIRLFGKLVIRSSNVQNDRLIFEDNVFVDRSCINSEDVKKGDIIICVRNGSASLIGKSAYVTSDLDATFGAFMSNLRCDDVRGSRFVYYFTKSMEFKKFVKQILGATINQITKTDLKRITLKMPADIKEQQAIAEILTAMDEEIESLEEEKAKMMQIREGAMDDLLTGRVRLKV